jgi:hypothetical protein
VTDAECVLRRTYAAFNGRDLAGRIVKDEIVHHVYPVQAGLITSMEIETRP